VQELANEALATQNSEAVLFNVAGGEVINPSE
jgi:hypothetical protein